MDNLIVLGTGRSGTSLLASLFVKNELYFGDNYLGKNLSNPNGFFEDNEVNEINDLILSTALPLKNERIRRCFFPWYPTHRARWLGIIRDTERLVLNDSLIPRIQERIAMRPFCYKDPRFSYTLRLWLPFLDAETKFICVFRHPSLTAQSILKECSFSPALKNIHLTFNRACDIWYCMYNEILRLYENLTFAEKQRWLFVNYGQLFEQRKLDEIEFFTGYNVDRQQPKKSINRTTGEVKVGSKLERMYRNLNSLAGHNPS